MTARAAAGTVEGSTPEVPMPAVPDALDVDPVAVPIDLDTAADLDDLLALVVPGEDDAL